MSDLELVRAHERLDALRVPRCDDLGQPLGLVLRISVLADMGGVLTPEERWAKDWEPE